MFLLGIFVVVVFLLKTVFLLKKKLISKQYNILITQQNISEQNRTESIMNSSTTFSTIRTATSITTVTKTTRQISPWKTNPREYKKKQKQRTATKNLERGKKYYTNNKHSSKMYGKKHGKRIEIYNEYEPVSQWEIENQFLNKKELLISNDRREQFFEAFEKSPNSPIWKIPKCHGYWEGWFQNGLAYYA